MTAACFGRMTLIPAQAKIVRGIFSLNEEERRWLTVVPYKGTSANVKPGDPLICRFTS
jgi:cyanate lyase